MMTNLVGRKFKNQSGQIYEIVGVSWDPGSREFYLLLMTQDKFMMTQSASSQYGIEFIEEGCHDTKVP